ncbi:MAG: hypothetical protein HC834_03250 [Rhodospirillales bacterium]|nr:hypothetical protein [Rhodospirillales bacterium]
MTVINNHLTSRFGSTPIFGGPQPFVQAGEAEREAQVLALHEVVRSLLDRGTDRRRPFDRPGVIVLGDLNTFEWTDDLATILPRGEAGDRPILFNLIDTIKAKKTPPSHRFGNDRRGTPTAGGNDAYTFIFDGNSQNLDHFFVTADLKWQADFDVVHVNVDFPRIDDSVGSDHEPLLARIKLKGPRQISTR